MAAKTVTIESKDYVFNTLKEAQKYYDAIVKELFEANLTLTTGQDFEDLKWIYRTYCSYTAFRWHILTAFFSDRSAAFNTSNLKFAQFI